MLGKKFLCLDLGTSKIVVYMKGKGVIYNEFSKVAYNTRTNKPICIGNEAEALDGKTSEFTRIEYPVVDGIINDMQATRDMLSMLAEKVKESNLWKGSFVLIACPSGITELEKSSLKEIATHLGANHVIIKESIQLAALGAELDFFSPKGNLIIDIGAGSSDVAVVSAGDSVISNSVRLSGDSINREIMLFIRNKYNILIGTTVINMTKLRIGCLVDFNPVKTLNIFGRDAISGLPKEIQINSTEICEIFKKQFLAITELLVDILDKTPPNLTYDVVKNGITIVGGMSKIKGIKDFFEKIFRFKVNLVHEPELAVIRGAIKWEKKLDKLLEESKWEKKQEYKIK